MTDHVHHDVVEDWFITLSDAFATCPLTQGALMRGLLRSGATSVAAVDVVRGLRAADKHEFWPDELGYDNIDLRGVVGYRQVTDAYLAGLTRSRGGSVGHSGPRPRRAARRRRATPRHRRLTGGPPRPLTTVRQLPAIILHAGSAVRHLRATPLLRDDVYVRLREAIVDGSLETGEQLRDGELAAWLLGGQRGRAHRPRTVHPGAAPRRAAAVLLTQAAADPSPSTSD